MVVRAEFVVVQGLEPPEVWLVAVGAHQDAAVAVDRLRALVD